MFETFVEHKAHVKAAIEAGLEPPRLPDYLGKCFMQIAHRLGTRGNFSGYTYLDEMRSDGIENCIIAANNFDPDKGENPFAYFTQITWFAFLRRIDKEKKHSYIKYKTMQNMNLNGLNIDGEIDDFRGNSQSVDNDFMDVIVSDFEAKKKRKDIKYQAAKKKKGVETFFEDDPVAEAPVDFLEDDNVLDDETLAKLDFARIHPDKQYRG